MDPGIDVEEQRKEEGPTTTYTQQLLTIEISERDRAAEEGASEGKDPSKHKENLGNHSLEEALSPSSAPRRSIRVSALKAQKKLTPNKEESDTMVDTQMEDNPPPHGRASQLSDHDAEIPAATALSIAPTTTTVTVNAADLKKGLKRKRTVDVEQLDQYDCKFGIRLDPQGEVVPLTDESEVSSLDEEDVMELRRRYTAFKKKNEVSEEVRLQRESQIKELEAALRLEEAKLSMLKKLRDNQQLALKSSEHAKRIAAAASNIHHNSSGNAYKPTLAVPSSQKLNGTAKSSAGVGKGARSNTNTATAALNNNSNAANSGAALTGAMLAPHHQQLLQTLLQKSGNNTQQLAQLLKQLTPEQIQMLLNQQQKMQQSQQQQSNAAAASVAAAAAAKSSAAAVAAKAREVAASNAQRISTARIQLRHSLEKQLLQIQPPKAPVPDLSFIPNANQPDFCALLGLDLVVQRVLKDKNVFKRMDFPPYECEECGTDYTPSWKAICDENEEYHLYCEMCVRLAQKRKIRQDHTTAVKRAFHRLQEQEKEFERQVAAGKFSDPIPTVPAIPPPPTTTTTPAAAKTLQQTSTPTNLAAPNTASASPAVQKPSHHQGNANSSGGGGGSGGGIGGQKAHQKKRASTGATPNAGAASNANSINAAALAALASNPAALQQRMAAMNAFSQMNNNPMMAIAMLSQNPMLMQQFWNQLVTTPRLPQQQQQQSNSSAASNNNAAMAALLQAAQQSAQQQHHQQHQNTPPSGGGRASNGNSSGDGSNNTNAGLNNLFAASLAQLNQLNPNNITNNPQLLRQFQQVQLMQQMREFTTKSGGGGGGGGGGNKK